MTLFRQIVLDTETTGLDPYSGHKIVEIGCLELINYLPSGKIYHTYINPERDVPESASEIHGLKADFLKKFPVFKEIHQDFLAFIEDSQLIIHNARFDMKFLNAELECLGISPLSGNRAIDTLAIARQKFPGSPASLDALCKRFQVDNSGRDLHGALLDAQLLAEVYLQLVGGRQPGFNLNSSSKTQTLTEQKSLVLKKQLREPRRLVPPTAEELLSHEKFMEEVMKKAG